MSSLAYLGIGIPHGSKQFVVSRLDLLGTFLAISVGLAGANGYHRNVNKGRLGRVELCLEVVIGKASDS